MKKVVPDPPSVFPTPYSTIIAAEDPAQRSTHLETLSISTELLHALLAHIKSQEAQA